MTAPDIRPAAIFPRHATAFARWLGERLGCGDVVLDHARQLTFGHSNQTWDVAASCVVNGALRRDRYILRCPPDGIGLLEPYDVGKQYRVMKALEGGDVPVPKMLWLEESGGVLGKPFFLMERLDGVAIEHHIPPSIQEAPPERIRAICEEYIDAVAAVHRVDWRVVDTGLPAPAADPVTAEIDWWDGQVRHYHPAGLPSTDHIVGWLRANRPAPAAPRLVHGDPKLGNLFLIGNGASVLLDWELASIGDPMCDLGWLSFQWSGAFTAGFTDLPGALSWDEMAARYTAATGIAVRDIHYFQLLQAFKATAICFVGYMMFAQGISDDARFDAFGPLLPPLFDMMVTMTGAPPVPHGIVLESLR